MNRFDGISRFSTEPLQQAIRKKHTVWTPPFPGEWLGFNFLRTALDFVWKNALAQQKIKSKKILLPAFICPVVVETILRNGLTPVLLDVNENDFNLSREELSKLDLDEFGAIVVSHTFGVPFETSRLKKAYKGFLIEDAAHAWGSEWNGKQIGMEGDVGLFSLYKQVGNLNGGWLWTRDLKLREAYEKLPPNKFSFSEKLQLLWKWEGPHQAILRAWRKHTRFPQSENPSQITWTLQKLHPLIQSLFAAQWPDLEFDIQKREHVAQSILKQLSHEWIPQHLSPEAEKAHARPSYFNLTLRLKDPYFLKRDAIVLDLRRKGIFVDRLWHNAAAVEPAYQKYLHGSCEVAQRLAHSVLNVPLRGDYTSEEIHRLVSHLNEAVNSV